MELPISLGTYHQLLGASAQTGYEKEDWEIGEAAIREWMVRNDPDSFPMPATAGYQWKSVFLPNGTLLRTIFNGKNYHCLVEDDRILYNGQCVSPSGFANAVGGVRRNAWKVVWLLFPGKSEWKLATTLRAKKNVQRSRPSSERQVQAARSQHGEHAPAVCHVPQPHAQRAERHAEAEPAPEHRAEQGIASGQADNRHAGEGDRAAGDDRQRSGRRDRRTGGERRRAQQPAHQQHAPKPEPAQHQQARVEGMQAETDLEHQWRQERHRADGHARQQAENGHRKDGSRQQAQAGPEASPPGTA
jgi:hypothetical protein